MKKKSIFTKTLLAAGAICLGLGLTACGKGKKTTTTTTTQNRIFINQGLLDAAPQYSDVTTKDANFATKVEQICSLDLTVVSVEGAFVVAYDDDYRYVFSTRLSADNNLIAKYEDDTAHGYYYVDGIRDVNTYIAISEIKTDGEYIKVLDAYGSEVVPSTKMYDISIRLQKCSDEYCYELISYKTDNGTVDKINKLTYPNTRVEVTSIDIESEYKLGDIYNEKGDFDLAYVGLDDYYLRYGTLSLNIYDKDYKIVNTISLERQDVYYGFMSGKVFIQTKNEVAWDATEYDIEIGLNKYIVDTYVVDILTGAKTTLEGFNYYLLDDIYEIEEEISGLDIIGDVTALYSHGYEIVDRKAVCLEKTVYFDVKGNILSVSPRGFFGNSIYKLDNSHYIISSYEDYGTKHVTDINGKILFSLSSDYSIYADAKAILVKINNYYGLVNYDGSFIIDSNYTSIFYLGDGCFKLNYNTTGGQKMGVIKLENGVITNAYYCNAKTSNYTINSEAYFSITSKFSRNDYYFIDDKFILTYTANTTDNSLCDIKIMNLFGDVIQECIGVKTANLRRSKDCYISFDGETSNGDNSNYVLYVTRIIVTESGKETQKIYYTIK